MYFPPGVSLLHLSISKRGWRLTRMMSWRISTVICEPAAERLLISLITSRRLSLALAHLGRRTTKYRSKADSGVPATEGFDVPFSPDHSR